MCTTNYSQIGSKKRLHAKKKKPPSRKTREQNSGTTKPSLSAYLCLSLMEVHVAQSNEVSVTLRVRC
jgi:hypothetical protein